MGKLDHTERSPITGADVAVTTSLSAGSEFIERAEQLASELECPYCDRGDDSLDEIRASTSRSNLIVLTHDEVRLVTASGSFWFHPNMARSRIEAMLRGGADRLANFMGLQAGDRVLDATCGLGADAIVAAYVVGPSGFVQAVERSPVLSTVVRHGMQTYQHRRPEIVEAMRRVEVTTGDASAFLCTQSDCSWDVVYFDPMFEATLDRSQGLDVVRRLACLETTSSGQILEASRVARRCVVMKDRAPGRKLYDLGFEIVSHKGMICYGRMDKQKSHSSGDGREP